MSTVAPIGPRPGAVLVHGLWHGGWMWDAVGHHLTEAGVPSVAVELPMTDLGADVTATHRALDKLAAPAVLVGHSYGGAVITEAGAHSHVGHLLYLAAFQLADGESVGRTLPDLQVPQTRLGDALRFLDDGRVDLDRALATELLYADTPPTMAAAAVARLRPVHRPVFSGVPRKTAWRQRPSTYVVCTEDRAVHPDLQRAMALRAGQRYEWPTGHCPSTSCPERVAALITALVTSLSGNGADPHP